MERYILVVVLCFVWTHQAFSAEWDYELGGPNGPKKWGGDCQTGKAQTPINIESLQTILKDDFGTIALTNYDVMTNYNFSAENNGHSLTINLPDRVYSVSGIGLCNAYTTAQFHLHWGSSNMNGSEHFLDGKQYAGELHFVSYNTKYPDLTTAANKPDGLAVLGVFLNVGGDNNSDYDFLKYATDVIGKDDTKGGIPSFKLQPMLPADLTEFFRYKGSLTTPGCFESVTWTVFKNTINISQYQMDLLRMLNDTKGMKLVDNFRPLQALNDRTVYSSFNISGQRTTTPAPLTTTPSTTDAIAVSMNVALFLLMLVAALFMH